MQKFILLVVFCIVLSACKFKPNLQEKGTAFMQGKWEEEPVDFQDSLIQYTRHQFTFTCDSVYITMETKATENYYPDSCFANGRWKEYAKGNYVISNDTLYILSTFTNAKFKQKLSGCYRIGQYLPSFVFEKKSSNILKLKSLQQHTPVTLLLKERIKCIQQPL